MKYTWTGDVKLFVSGVGTIPPHSSFEMDKATFKLDGVQYLIGTGEIVKGVPEVAVEQDAPPDPEKPDNIEDDEAPEKPDNIEDSISSVPGR